MAEKTLTFQGLPQEIQDWLSSESVESIIEELNKKYQLKGYATGAISLMTTWLLIKTIDPEEFLDILMDEFSLDSRAGSELTKDIYQRILLPIKNGLRRSAELDITKLQVEPRMAPQKRVVASVSPLPSQTVAGFRAEAPRPRPDISERLPRQANLGAGKGARTTKINNPIFNEVAQKNVSIPKPDIRPAKEVKAPPREPLHQQARIFKAPESFQLSETKSKEEPTVPHTELTLRIDPHPAKTGER